MTNRVMFCVTLFGAAVSTPLTTYRSPLTAQDTVKGKAVYVKWCAGCHGDTGAGDGAAAPAMVPRPRNFTGADNKIRTTASGQLPTDADLMRAIDEGLPGSAMPAWKARLSEAERRDVIAYIKTFSSFFTDTSQHIVPLGFGGEPGGGTSAQAVKTGRSFYDSIGCRKCHGDQGRGDGPSAPTLKDDAGFPIFAADLHQSWRFRGGGRTEDIYRRLRTGLDGTPMPSFSDLIYQKLLTDEQLWRLSQYVRSLSPAREPEVRDVIHAPQLGGTLPAAPDDTTWARVDRYWFPLVGQVIRKPRWFAPTVSGVWVQAVHNGRELALRLCWDDRTLSPDTAWLAFERRVLETVASDDSTPAVAGVWPDQVAVQLPRHIPDGMERPYFLMGTGTDPVYQWRWTSEPRRAVAGLARGLEQFDTLGGAPESQAVWDHGEWRVVLTRSLATPDTANELQFVAGRAIPVALFAWDGPNGEHGSRLAGRTWDFPALDQPTPPRVCVPPFVASRRPRSAQAGATITGKVKFAGRKPAMPKIDMSEEPKCKAKYTAAPPTEETVVVNPDGTLANVFVYVKSGLPASYKAPAPSGPVTLDQDGCRYHPHAFGIMVGQNLQIKNSDGILHNIKAKGTKNRPFNISQPTTMTSTRTFSAPEVMVPLECNVHGWMHAWLGVLPHAFYGVSGADGTFSITGLPPGTYTVEAWHEKYGTQTATVTVSGGETKTADFTFAGKWGEGLE